ncbi:PVC-type heme-binding CxxCH protein [Reichenbachiella sp. MALMAid0571]|uniref:PVC-type heme-binding CxxCH protein n=1 Tax=Reichenbachiella sp. MALMAid0571 TaxID=3143939 RepID=UPI0032DF5925
MFLKLQLSQLLAGIILPSMILVSSCEDTRKPSYEVPELDVKTTTSNGFVLPEGWEATLWAESPDLYNPTNLDVDVRGRVWVTEAVNYRGFNNKPEDRLAFDKGDRVMILEDTNGDGICDSSKVFVQDKDLVAPLGVAVIGNKVLVSCAPTLFVYTDENGDDVPDKREVFLTGFGGFDHDHSLHSIVAGPDGKWYFNTGNAGPHVVTDKSGWMLRSGSVYTGGTPYNKSNEPAQVSDDGRIWVGGLALRIGSDGSGLEVVGHNFRNAYELALDSYGNMWQNDNDDQVETCRTTWLMEGGNAGYFNADGSRTWQADRKPDQDIFTAHWHQNDPGVIPAGDNTGAGSPTGVVVYEGDAFGSQFQGMLLSVDAGRNVVFAYQPKQDGAGFDLNRRNLVTSMNKSTEGYIWHEVDGDTRKWFRPSDAAVGTDGSIFISDWYDPVVGGHKMMDSVGYGRIYRITPKGVNLKPPKLDLNTTEGQITALLNPAVNVRNLGFEKLKNQGAAVLPDVEKILKSDNPYHQARAIWLLTQLGDDGVSVVENILKIEPNSRLRVTAYRALKNRKESLLKYAKIAVDDPSVAVKREVAISLRDVPWEKCEPFIEELFQNYDGKDRWYLEALGMAFEGKEDQAYKYLLPDQGKLSAWSDAFASLVWRLHPKSSIPLLKERAMAQNVPDSLRKMAVDALAFIPDKEAVAAMIELGQMEKGTPVSDLANWWLGFRKNNDWFALWDWESLEKSETFEVPEEIALLQKKLLNESTPNNERIEAGKKMAGDVIGGRLLISLASNKQLSNEMIAAISSEIFKNPEMEIRTLASEYFIKSGGKQLSTSNISALKGDIVSGEKAFMTKCITCHKIGDKGMDIGPNLSGVGEKYDQAALLDAIINPSAAIVFGYQPVMVKTKSGQAIYGFLLSEGETTVIKDMTGNQTVIQSNDIESKKQMDTSIMPDAVALGLNEQGLADITTYLLSLN